MQTTDTSSFLRAEAELVLEEARRQKSERTKDLGWPITLTYKPLDVHVQGNEAWIAASTAVVRVLDLETGKTVKVFNGHTAPVTCIAFCDEGRILISGSWDQTIRLWNTETKSLISSTSGHGDFVKTLFVLPSLQLLISGGSDKVVRFWDLSTCHENKPLTSVGSISSHTRPVESMAGHAVSDSEALLITGDTMGVINVWELKKEDASPPRWRTTLRISPQHHRTRINQMVYGEGHLWSASADETAQINPLIAPDSAKPIPPITHPTPVRCLLPISLTGLTEPYLITGSGDVIYTYDVSSPEEPELLSKTDAHWHDVTALRLWMRKTTGDDGLKRVEPWVVSASLDGTLRKWRLAELLKPAPPAPVQEEPALKQPQSNESGLTEEEERELAELMDD